MRLLHALLLVAVLGAATCSISYKNDVIKRDDKTKAIKPDDYQHHYDVIEDYEDDDMFFNQKPCPRDCICKTTSGSTVARCSRLEVGTQKFGNDITDVVVEDYHRKYPIVLSDRIFSKLGLTQVNTVKIVNSIISSISPTAFLGLNDLYSVNLTGNEIETLSPDVFSTNEKLYLLSLSNNPLILSRMDEDYSFLPSTTIQELDLSRCNLTDIPRKTFSGMKSLMYINLSGNKLTGIDSHVFSELKDLEEIDLSDNDLKSIPIDLFANNSEMTSLNIGGNPLDHIPGMKIPELLTLTLKDAKIRIVGPSMFEGMRYLSNVNLSGNGIQKIYDSAFDALSELSYLDLSNNDLDAISSTIINNNAMLDVFKIRNNPRLSKLPEEGFLCNEKQFSMYLFDASDCSIEIIPDKTFKHMYSINSLYLARNKIYKLGKSLHSVVRLTELDLSYNAIETLDKQTFSHNRDLNKLNLAGNPIVTLSSEVFANNPVLRWLDLSSCQLFQLWENGDSHPSNILSTLHYLNISNNQLQTVRRNELEMIKQLYTLDISQNPLQCSEEFENLIFWLKQQKVSLNTHLGKSEKLKTIEKEIGKPNPSSWEILSMQVCNYVPSSTTESITTTLRTKPSSKSEDVPKFEDDQEYEDDYYYDDNSTDITDDNEEKEPVSKEIVIEEINSNGDNKTVIIEDGIRKVSVVDSDGFDLVNDTIVNDIKGNEIDPDADNEILIEEIKRDWSLIDEDKINTSAIYTTIVYVLALFILILISLFVVKLVQRSYQRKRMHTIITVAGANSRRDCGLVYQPLTEDLTSPKTPIIKKNTLINNIRTACNETNPFYQKVNPEIV